MRADEIAVFVDTTASWLESSRMPEMARMLRRLVDEREALLEALRFALSTHLHPFGDHTADACGMCSKFRAAIAKAEAE